MQSSMKTTYIFPILCTKFKLNFSFAVKLSSNFLQLKYLQILRKLYSIFFVLSTDLLWNRYHFAIPVFALIFFHLHVLARKPIIYLFKFFHNFHFSKSSFICPGLRASGLARRLPFARNQFGNVIMVY